MANENENKNQGQGSNRGFAAMDEEEQRNIASKGGQSVPDEKRSFSKDRGLASEAGRKGGEHSQGGQGGKHQPVIEPARRGGLPGPSPKPVLSFASPQQDRRRGGARPARLVRVAIATGARLAIGDRDRAWRRGALGGIRLRRPDEASGLEDAKVT